MLESSLVFLKRDHASSLALEVSVTIMPSTHMFCFLCRTFNWPSGYELQFSVTKYYLTCMQMGYYRVPYEDWIIMLEQ